MVGVMAGSEARNKALNLLNAVKFPPDLPSKLENLGRLGEVIVSRDPSLLREFLPHVVEFQSDKASPVRKFIAEIIGEIGFKHMSFLPELVPVLISLLNDATPAVARQAVTSGAYLFQKTMGYIAFRGLYSEELDNLLESSWTSITKLKEALYEVAFQSNFWLHVHKPGNDGARILAVRFVKSTILLFTPDPNGSSQSPPQIDADEKNIEFNISWLRSGHPLLTTSDLALEASRNLGLLLDMLRSPSLKTLSNSVIVVLINSLSDVAKKRPAFYGRILPVILGLDASVCTLNGSRISGVPNALKHAFLTCLKCSHPGAIPWRDRLIEALKAMDAGELADEALSQLDKLSSEVQPLQEAKGGVELADLPITDHGKKRSVTQDTDFTATSDSLGKRIRQAPPMSQGQPTVSVETNLRAPEDFVPNGIKDTSTDEVCGPVQQLVAMFGALVAQGDKATGSLEILIGSISSDLLAEVVIANMRHLPPCRPNVEEEEETVSVGFISSLVSSTLDIKPSSNTLEIMTSVLGLRLPASCDSTVVHHIEKSEVKEATYTTSVPVKIAGADMPVVSHSPSVTGNFNIQPMINDVGPSEASIPGLEGSAPVVGSLENEQACYASTADSLGTHREDAASSGLSFANKVPSTATVSTDHSEALSPRESAADTSWISSAASTNVAFSTSLSLNKTAPPTANLSEEQKDELQKLAYIRIINTYKSVAITGGSDVHFSVLAYIGSEYPLELDAWGLLQKHILDDYLNHEGHELTLRVLYKLFVEAEQEHDFFASTTATSAYETFLLTVAESLRDSFPASDKSLSRLFGEAPYLPKPVFKLLECLCSPGNNEIYSKELKSGDRVTQGLSAVWSLILLRPPIRDVCLKIALQSAVHHLEEVRMKAIRLVANKLYPMSCISQTIEEFASEKLLSAVNDLQTTLLGDGNSSKNTDGQLAASDDVSEALVSEAQRCMSLYFALCTKKHSLLWQVFTVYRSASEAAKEAIRKQIPILVRTIGSSAELLSVISDLPAGSENLLMLVLHTLTDGAIPSPDLICAVKRLYESKLKDVAILIPILSSMPKDEILPIFPKLVGLPLDKFRAVLNCILKGPSPVLSPAEVLIAIHGIDPDKDGIALKKVTDACSACFERQADFTQQVLAKVLNQLVEQIPLPLLFMRTVIQSIGACPSLVDFVMDILLRLVNKQIWKFPKLWVGFLKCALQTQPQSFGVLLQLPAAQLENALNRSPPLRVPLVAHASQPNICSSLPRSTLVVLGLASDSQPTSQAQSVQQTSEHGNAGGTFATETTQESSAAG
ncbi:uncharacterized protein LOC116247253 isoform X1 [Nymphaea colorata]|nr:uncharacterized protein LOC116247253 isoform X1 [Nymphaea colorata]